jgi:hypothetical protein
MNTKISREDWLFNLTEEFRPKFESAGYPLPQLRVTCGFPSTGGTRLRTPRVVGEVHDSSNSADGHFEIFISPVNADSKDVAVVLVHQLVRSAVGISSGHNRTFREVAVKVGLAGTGIRNGNFRNTVAAPAFERTLRNFVEVNGDYPHATLNVAGITKQSTRLIKLVCPVCGVTARASASAIAAGKFKCGVHDVELVIS